MFFKKKEEVYITTYYCKKCQRSVHFMPNQEINTTCKYCGNGMQFQYKRPYHPDRGLDAIKAASASAKKRNEMANLATLKPIVTCPYCNSTDTKKISNASKAIAVGLFGIFALGKANKEWHCNNCNSDF